MDRLQKYDEAVEEFHRRLRELSIPDVPEIVGMLNMMGTVFRRTQEQGIDPMNPTEPLVALPQHLRYMEQRLNAALHRVGTIRVSLKAD